MLRRLGRLTVLGWLSEWGRRRRGLTPRFTDLSPETPGLFAIAEVFSSYQHKTHVFDSNFFIAGVATIGVTEVFTSGFKIIAEVTIGVAGVTIVHIKVFPDSCSLIHDPHREGVGRFMPRGPASGRERTGSGVRASDLKVT